MTAIRLRRWHAARHVWWYENDSNDAKVVTVCGIRRDHTDTYLGASQDEEWCSRCYPYGKPEVVLIRTPEQLRQWSEAR